jgi:hypothetical protein
MANTTKIVYDGRTYTGTEIQNGNMRLATSLLSSSLESNTFNVTLKSPNKNLTNFSRNAPITVFNGERQLGIFYVQDVKRTAADLYKVSATSAVGILSDGNHYGGIYTGQTAESIIGSICGSVKYDIQNKLRPIKLYGWLPIATPRDNLAQVLFAMGATLRTDLNGVLRIEELWDGLSGDIGTDRMYQGASVEYASKVTQVSLTEHQYVASGDLDELFSGTTQSGDIITFDEPVYGLTASGFTIQSQGANFAKLSAGNGTLKGRKYKHNTREIIKTVSSASEPNIKAVKDATLVSLVNSQAVSNNLVNYLKWNRTIKTSVVYQGEIPGDLISTWDPFDKTSVDVCIQEADIILSNTIKANEKMLVGFTPIRQEGSESYEYHVVLTGSGTWTVPEGTTSVRAVLIGAGGAGFDGSPGGDSTETWEGDEIKTTRINLTAPTTSANDSSNVSNRGAGTPGNGGAGGAAGTPGKVYEVTFSPSNGSRISYSCGSKGTSNGALGGATTFGSYSSNSGSTSSAGYTDIISGITYAKSGDSGADGGKGGSGADGESVGGVSGGKQEPSGSATRSDSDTQRRSNISMDIDATANFSLGAAGGGGAGGNSGNNLGTPGGDAEVGSVRLSITTGYINAFVYPNKGGTGGDGADGADASVYGCSGSGAGGGGGAGGDSSASSNVSAQYYVYNITIETRTDFAINNNAGGAAVRKGGAGGKGGAGADGCIILYYGVTTPVQDGQLKDKNGLMLLDKYGRRLIV